MSTKPQTLKLLEMAHGGSAIARGKKRMTVFVPYGIPGELVRATITHQKNEHGYAELISVLQPSPDRIESQCSHFSICGGCHFQHIQYEAQLDLKRTVVVDQMARIGKIKDVPVSPMLPNPDSWAYRREIELSPVKEGGLGFWSPSERRVFPIAECPITQPELLTLLQDIDLELPGLRKLTLRCGDDEALLAAIEVDEVEPPLLEADFPISVAIVMPNRSAATLVGDHYSVFQLKGRDFRVSPGCYLAASAAGMGQVVDAVLRMAALTGSESIMELYSGVGTLTAFLAEQAAQVTAVEWNRDAVADTAVNLEHTDNVSVYEGRVEQVLPTLTESVDVMVINPPKTGLSRDASKVVVGKRPSRLIYVSSDVATMARDSRNLARSGYKLIEIQPIDMKPQSFHIETVSLWEAM
ncbi:MAG: class I SAM-dependent RNA methyltransferase [Chloroflexi bacterium]|nr:class I SAM-dependent RNA methyltransferase [Chloroflexota bacterium]